MKSFAGFLARVFVGSIYAYAGFSKLVEPLENFRGAVAGYEILPYTLVPAIAFVLPWLELIFGVFLILGYLPRVSAAALGVISLSFVGLLASTYFAKGTFPDDCGCFGKNSLLHLSGFQVLLLDTLNSLLSLRLFLLREHPWSLDRVLRK